jgi:hypothetical protein
VDHLHAVGPLARFGHEGNDGVPAAPEHRRTHLSLADLGSTQRHERGHFGTSAQAGFGQDARHMMLDCLARGLPALPSPDLIQVSCSSARAGRRSSWRACWG